MAKKTINMDALLQMQKTENNVYMTGNNILLEQEMLIDEPLIEILKKWRINEFELHENIETSTESFSTLYKYDKEIFVRLNHLMQKEISEYYEAVEKNYKVPMPDFQNIFNQLDQMTTIKALSFVFFLHMQQSNSLVKSVIRSTTYAVMTAKRMKLAKSEVLTVFYANIFSEIGFLKRGEANLAAALKNRKPEILDYTYIKSHVQQGYQVFKELLNYSKEYALILLLHHDYEDKSGYNKVGKDKIFSAVQIITFCQEFTYLSSQFLQDAVEPTSFANAILEMLRKKNRYNQEVINAFISLFSFYPPGEFLLLEDGSIAISVSTRTEMPQYPTIEKVANEHGVPNEEPSTINTRKEKIKIIGTISNKNLINSLKKSIYS